MKKFLKGRMGSAVIAIAIPGAITLPLAALLHLILGSASGFWRLYGILLLVFGGWSIVSAVLFAFTKVDEDFVITLSSVFYYVGLVASLLVSQVVGVSQDADMLSLESAPALALGYIFAALVAWIVALKRKIRKLQEGENK